MAEDLGIRTFRNHLPQWRLDGGVYFVTWSLRDRLNVLVPQEKEVIAASLKLHHRERYDLSVFVIMDDHVHALVHVRPGFDLSDVLKSWKGCTARAINRLRGRSGSLWEKDSYTELMRNQAAIQTRREYIYNNPFRAWGCQPHEYKWLEWFE